MKFPRKCVDCDRLATKRVSYASKTYNVCDKCAKKIRKLGGDVPASEAHRRLKHDSIRVPKEETDIDLAVLSDAEFDFDMEEKTL